LLSIISKEKNTITAYLMFSHCYHAVLLSRMALAGLGVFLPVAVMAEKQIAFSD
jgi:hypothetical protein